MTFNLAEPGNNKYFRLKEDNPTLLGVALTRHWDTCSSNPGVGGIFSFLWPFSVIPYLLARSTTVLKYKAPVC